MNDTGITFQTIFKLNESYTLLYSQVYKILTYIKMLKYIEEINENNKRSKAYFTNGKTTKFGQSYPKHGTFIDHKDKTLKRKYTKSRVFYLRQGT